MAAVDRVTDRMKEARIQTGARLRPPKTVSQELMAEMVSEVLGRTIHPTQWRRYESETEPPLDVIRATAEVSGLDESYIAFGPRRYPALDLDPARDRKLTDDEVRRALRVAERETGKPAKESPRSASRGGQGRGKGR